MYTPDWIKLCQCRGNPVLIKHTPFMNRIYQGSVSILICLLTRLRIPMLKIRRSRARLIFNMGIPIPGKVDLYIEMGPWFQTQDGLNSSGEDTLATNGCSIMAVAATLQLKYITVFCSGKSQKCFNQQVLLYKSLLHCIRKNNIWNITF